MQTGRQARAAARSPKTSAIITLSDGIPASATLFRATWPRAPRRRSATKAAALGLAAWASILISRTRSSVSAANVIEERYGNLFDMYYQITGENPYEMPMRIYPAIHYTMGGLWVDYHLMSTIPGLFVLGEANFSDHGANRLGASALMQGLSDGYFVIPYTIGNYLASNKARQGRRSITPEFKDAEERCRRTVKKLLSISGKRTVNSIHRELGKIMWDNCGMARNAAGLAIAIGRDSGTAGRVLAERERARRQRRA